MLVPKPGCLSPSPRGFVSFEEAKKKTFDEVLESVFIGRGIVDAHAMPESSETVLRKIRCAIEPGSSMARAAK